MFAGDNIQGVSGSPVSWEHFFHSLMLYHENLRRDLPNPDAAHYRHPPLRGITQRELEGLTSFLQLLTTIITWVWCNILHKDRYIWLHGLENNIKERLTFFFLLERKCSIGFV